MAITKCRSCGCTDLNACWDDKTDTPCFWVEPNLCSSCAGQARRLGEVKHNPAILLHWDRK